MVLILNPEEPHSLPLKAVSLTCLYSLVPVVQLTGKLAVSPESMLLILKRDLVCDS